MRYYTIFILGIVKVNSSIAGCIFGSYHLKAVILKIKYFWILPLSPPKRWKYIILSIEEIYKELTTWLTMQALFSSQHNQLRCWISCCAKPKGVSRQIIYLLFFPCFSTEMTSSEPDLSFQFELIRYTRAFFLFSMQILNYWIRYTLIYSPKNKNITVMSTTDLIFNDFSINMEQENAHSQGYQRPSKFTLHRISRVYKLVTTDWRVYVFTSSLTIKSLNTVIILNLIQW